MTVSKRLGCSRHHGFPGAWGNAAQCRHIWAVGHPLQALSVSLGTVISTEYSGAVPTVSAQCTEYGVQSTEYESNCLLVYAAPTHCIWPPSVRIHLLLQRRSARGANRLREPIRENSSGSIKSERGIILFGRYISPSPASPHWGDVKA